MKAMSSQHQLPERVFQQDEASLTTHRRLSKKRTRKAGQKIPRVLPWLGMPLPRVTPGIKPAASVERHPQGGHPPVLQSFTLQQTCWIDCYQKHPICSPHPASRILLPIPHCLPSRALGMQQLPPASVGPACTGGPTSFSSAARHAPENTSQHLAMLSSPGKTPLLASLGAARNLLGCHQSSTPDPVQHRGGAQRLRFQQWPFLAHLCLVSFPPLLPSNSAQGGWWGFVAHPALGRVVEQGRDWEVPAVSPGLGTGQYLLEAKDSTPAPSPTCTGGCVRPPRHRQCPRDSSPRQGWAQGGDALAAAGTGGDEATAGLRWRFPTER